MANELDELTGPVNESGRETHVIEKQIQPKTGAGTVFFEVLLFILGIIPGIIFVICKVKAKQFLDQLQQRVQHAESQVDAVCEKRNNILQNAVKWVNKKYDMDKEVINAFKEARGINAKAAASDKLERLLFATVENYPQLESTTVIRDFMQQNQYTMAEITAARDLYNDVVLQWNAAIFQWPCKKMVASKNKYTTRIPFSVSAEVKQRATNYVY